MRKFGIGAAALGLSLFAGGLVSAPAYAAQPAGTTPAGLTKSHPVVIGHRGASGYRPEHTLASYRLAIELGADYIEPDLVETKDGVLVARHENEIGTTTDVSKHPEFASRKTTKTVDGNAITGWFTEDFTLKELKTLRAVERLPLVRPANTKYDGKFQIPTFQEVIDLAKSESRKRHRTIGIYPETKHPTYFRSIGLPLEEKLVKTLRCNGLASKRSKVFIQSFETGNLERLNKLIDVPLVQLIDATGGPFGDGRKYSDLVTPAGLADVAKYADGVGLNTALVVPSDPATGKTTTPTTVVADAHEAGLLVHVWTVRWENQFLPADFKIGTDPNARGDIQGWLELLLDQGIDGAFSDFPDQARKAVDAQRAAA